MTGEGVIARPFPLVIASLFSLSLRAKRGNLEEQNPKSEIRNTKQYQMTKIQMTKGVLSFEFGY
jgi:hypothetical protein